MNPPSSGLRPSSASSSTRVLALLVGAVGVLVVVQPQLRSTAVGGPLTVEPASAVEVAAPVVEDPAVSLTTAAVRDAPAVAALVGSWVPQVASAPAGQDPVGYWQAHQELQVQYGAVLLSSDSYVFARSGYWVSVVPVAFASAQEALGWCGERGLPDGDCYAKLLTTDAALAVTTAHQG